MVDRKDDIYEATVAELLTEATEHELARRDGDWDAFTASVFRKMDAEEVATQRADLEAQAVSLFKQEIDVELSEMSPKFEEAFRESIEKRIFQSAIEAPSWSVRAKAWFQSLARPQLAVGWAGAAAAVVLLVAGVGSMQSTGKLDELATGNVSVQQISFEGDVTVLPDDGVTVIWLDSAAS
jgi:hypothetical protein